MTTISAGNLTKLRTERQSSNAWLSAFQPVTLLTALVNDSGVTRGQRSIDYDTGSGSGYSTIAYGQMVEVDTDDGTQLTWVISITGSQSSGTITVAENGIVWGNNMTFRVKHFYGIRPAPPDIRSGIFYKFYSVTYTNQNLTPNPVCVMGTHRAGFLSSGSIAFSITAAGSYAVANGASISSYSWSCVHNGGGTSGITIASASSASTTITITTADQYWLSCTVTDSNGKQMTGYRALFVHDANDMPFSNFTIQSLTGDWDGGGWKMSLNATGATPLSEFPDGTLVVVWYQNKFNGVAGYVNMWGISDEVLITGYLRQDTDSDNFSEGTGNVTFQISTVDDLLNNVGPLGTISLNAVTSPAKWYEYANWMTVGRSIYHLILWHAYGIAQTVDIIGLTSNTLRVKNTDYSENNFGQMINNLAWNKGIFAKFICDRLGRLHLVQDSQMLGDAARAALDTIFIVTTADVSGSVDVVRQPEATVIFTQMDGFYFDGSTSTPFVSIIPGYRESGVSYIMPDDRGGATAQVGNQVLDSTQALSNERVGRYHATQNNNPRELRYATPGNYIGAYDIIPSAGWYNWGIADDDLVRNTELYGRLMVCRHVEAQCDFQGGIIGVNVVLEPEAIGPDGIQGNYPTSYPTVNPFSNADTSPDWDTSNANNGSQPALVGSVTIATGGPPLGYCYCGFAPSGGTLYFFDGYNSSFYISRSIISPSTPSYSGRTVIDTTPISSPLAYSFYNSTIPGFVGSARGANLWTPASNATPSVPETSLGSGAYLNFGSDWLDASNIIAGNPTGANPALVGWITGVGVSNNYRTYDLGDGGGTNYHLGICQINSSQMLMMRRDASGNLAARVVFMDLSDDELESLGSATSAYPIDTTFGFLRKMDDSNYAFVYSDGTDWKISVITVSGGGSSVSIGAPVTLTISPADVAVINSTTLAMVYTTGSAFVYVSSTLSGALTSPVTISSSLGADQALAVGYIGGYAVCSYLNASSDLLVASVQL